MNNIKNPFSAIKKVPLYGDDLKSSAYSIQISDPFNIEKPWNEVGIVSKDYMLVSNQQITDMVDNVIKQSDIDFAIDKTFFNGKQFIRSYKAIDEIDAEVQVGDNHGIGAGIWNSYDGSTSARFVLFAYRLACKNGMLSKHNFAEYIFKHDIYNKDWKHEVEKTSKVLANELGGLSQLLKPL